MLCQILLATGGTQLDSTGGVESVVDLIYAAKLYANYPGGSIDCGLNKCQIFY